jgi:hypothetical protein
MHTVAAERDGDVVKELSARVIAFSLTLSFSFMRLVDRRRRGGRGRRGLMLA